MQNYVKKNVFFYSAKSRIKWNMKQSTEKFQFGHKQKPKFITRNVTIRVQQLDLWGIEHCIDARTALSSVRCLEQSPFSGHSGWWVECCCCDQLQGGPIEERRTGSPTQDAFLSYLFCSYCINFEMIYRANFRDATASDILFLCLKFYRLLNSNPF